MKNTYNRGTYRGRSPVRAFLKGTILLLVAILLLVGAAVFFLQPYVVYSADGAKLVLPFLQITSPTPTLAAQLPDAVPTPTLVVVTPVPKEPDALHAVLLPNSALTDGTAASLLADAGGNAAIFDMKADSGALAYVSSLPLAVQAKTSLGDLAANTAIQALNAQENLYTVARISCFKDDRLSDVDKELNILTNSGYRWTDPQKLMWSSPTNAAVRQYLAGVCRELAALGFDEILLDNSGYPTEGNLGYIKNGPAYDKGELASVITGFYGEVRAALADYPTVMLSIVTHESVIQTGSDSLSGQTLTAMTTNAHRVWTDLGASSRTQLSDLLSAGGMEAPNQSLVAITTVGGAVGDSWAVWPVA